MVPSSHRTAVLRGTDPCLGVPQANLNSLSLAFAYTQNGSTSCILYPAHTPPVSLDTGMQGTAVPKSTLTTTAT